MTHLEQCSRATLSLFRGQNVHRTSRVQYTHTHKRRQTYTLQMKQKAERERQWNSSPHSSKYGRVCQEQSTRNDGFVGTHTNKAERERKYDLSCEAYFFQIIFYFVFFF